MLEYKNEIQSFNDLQDLCWSGALTRLDEIAEYNLEDEFMLYLEEMFSCVDTPQLVDINDFIWFECDSWIEEHKEEEEEEEEEEDPIGFTIDENGDKIIFKLGE